MSTSKIVGSRWLILMHYLIGKNEQISYVAETHKMLALDYQDYVKAFESSKLKVKTYLNENLWDGCRGLFIAGK
jgi:hypothetical protein